MLTAPPTSPALAPRWRRGRFWFNLFAGIVAVALLLAVALVVIIGVGEARWSSRHRKPLPPPANTVATFDARTGAPLNAALIRDLTYPMGLAVSGDTLYLVQASGNKIPPGRFDFGTVGKYDARTGAPIDAAFINRGLFNPHELALAGGTLFVHNYGVGKVAAYDAVTGALVNDAFIDHSFDAAGRQGVNMKLTGMAASLDRLYVAETWQGLVNWYRPHAGAGINHMEFTTGALLVCDMATGAVADHSLLGKLDMAGSVAWADGALFVVTDAKGTLGKYDAKTGQPINAAFIRKLGHPAGLAVSAGRLYVLHNEAGTVDAYDAATGAAVASPLITGLVNPVGMAVSGNTLYLIVHAGDSSPAR